MSPFVPGVGRAIVSGVMCARLIPARSGARAAAAAAVLALSLVAGCGGHSVQPAPAASTAPADPTDPVAHMRTVLIDPGHNGGNDPKQMAKKVPDGRGHTKPCNTTGTSTDDGYPEHRFAYYVAARVRGLLIANGINVEMTRTNDTGVGPCVDARGKKAAEVNADAVVSIHADGAPPDGQGFHVIYPKPPLNAAQGAPSVSLATALRDALRGAGFPESTYAGKNGLIGRSDLAGLNFSKRPVALVECANMRNPQEAVTVSNSVGQARYAQAIAVGILAWLRDHPPASAKPSASAEPSARPRSARSEDDESESSDSSTSAKASARANPTN